MSNFPESLDTDVELPLVTDNIDEIGAEAINALRDAVFNIEAEIGIGASGTAGSIADRLAVALESDGNIRPSALTSLGLVTLPIRNDQIAADAAISESKLNLYFGTSYLNDLIALLRDKQRVTDEFLSQTGIKVEPHIAGTGYRHLLSEIDVDNPSGVPNLSTHILNKKNISRNISDAFQALLDLNTDYVLHQKSDSFELDATDPNTGTLPPDNYAHVSKGIFLDTSSFTTLDKTSTDLQLFAEAVDQNSLLLLGSRVQNLYSNGIPRTSRASTLDLDGYGQNIIPVTLVKTFLLDSGASSPVDDIDVGDDLVQFLPDITDNTFDAKFAEINPGDIIRIDYGTALATYLVQSKKYTVNKSGPTVIAKSFYVRLNGKNLAATTSGLARIDKTLFNENKFGVLALAHANNINLEPSQTDYPSLIVGNPRSANALGLGFDASKIDSTHYNLYLELYPNGNLSSAIILPAIDLTGNQGATPGKYTLDSVITEFNNVCRTTGFNYRFMAYSYGGDFGVMLADPYNNTSFSIVGGNVDPDTGLYDITTSESNFPNSVFGIDGYTISQDPLGFGPDGSGLASPPYAASFSTPEGAIPTIVFVPLQRNFYHVNGVETEILKKEVFTSRDSFGDGYWPATIIERNILSDRIEVTYLILLNLSTSGLAPGKTLVVQNSSSLIDNGRFIITDVIFDDCDCDGYTGTTTIKVYDGIHSTGISPYAPSSVTSVNIYFSNDSLSFNNENVSDTSVSIPYRRFFEVLIDQEGHTFTHERARFSLSDTTDIRRLNLINVSPKLRGYTNQINLNLSYNSTNGTYTGRLSKDGSTHLGTISIGRKGAPTRFYDETNVDFIEILLDIDDAIPTFSNKDLTIELFKTLSLDDEVMLIGTCQIDDLTKKVTFVKDVRQFGNVSEKILSTSALDFISAGEKYLHENGIIRGFDISMDDNIATLTGGVALVNGKIINKNNGYVTLPYLQEVYSSTTYTNIQWAICLNDKGDYKLIPILDFDSGLDVPNDSSRLFTVKNPVNLLTYNLESASFSYLAEFRKDLTLLHIVTTLVT